MATRAQTHRIALLTEKVLAVTTTTEQIKTEISDAAWNRQKRWELKREVLFEAAKRVAEVGEAAVAFNNEKWSRAIVGFDEATILVGITCGRQTWDALENFRLTANKMLLGIPSGVRGSESEKYISTESRRELWKHRDAARAAIRKELGIDDAP